MAAIMGISMVLILLTVVFSICQITFLTLAVYFDCKARHIKNTTMWTLLTLFFGFIPAIIYLCTRNSAEKEQQFCSNCGAPNPVDAGYCSNCSNAFAQMNVQPVDEGNAKKSKIFTILLIVFLVLSMVTGIITGVAFVTQMGDELDDLGSSLLDDFDWDDNDLFDDDDNDTSLLDETDGEYYDMKGNKYTNIFDVVYYDANGNEYVYNYDNASYVDKDKNYYSPFDCYINQDGYFYHDKDKKVDFNDDFELADEKGNTYDYISGVFWTKDGKVKSVYFGDALFDE